MSLENRLSLKRKEVYTCSRICDYKGHCSFGPVIGVKTRENPTSKSSIAGHPILWMILLFAILICVMGSANAVTPEISNETPTNETTEVAFTPWCHVYVNDTTGHTFNVTWYEKTTGDWVLQQTNSTCANGTYWWRFTNATTRETTYYWRVNVTDGENATSTIYNFETKWVYIPMVTEETKTDIIDIVVWGFVLAIIVAVLSFVTTNLRRG